MQIDKQQLILNNLLTNEDFCRKVLPYIDPEYFEGTYRKLFVEIGAHVVNYGSLPTESSLKIDLDSSTRFNEDEYGQALEILPALFTDAEVDEKWLYDVTEKWAQERALFNAIMQSVAVIDGVDKKMSKDGLPSLLQTALAVTFNPAVGHDYFDDVTARYDFYHENVPRIPVDLDIINDITRGGFPIKTLNVILAGTGVGKSLMMCHLAANALAQGRNVLYITMEMAEERIAERIDANLLDVPLDQLEVMEKNVFVDRLTSIKNRSSGKLIIKEYPTGSAHVGHFRALLNELKLKKNFIPEIIFVDYLNIMSSERIRAMGGTVGSYGYIKAIAEELRGLGVSQVVPIITATQTNREGFSNSDPDLDDTAESFGLPATADWMVVITTSDEMDKLGQVMVKQLKNRYDDKRRIPRFVLGIDRSRMKLFDVDESEQTLIDTGPVMDTGSINDRTNDFKDFNMS